MKDKGCQLKLPLQLKPCEVKLQASWLPTSNWLPRMLMPYSVKWNWVLYSREACLTVVNAGWERVKQGCAGGRWSPTSQADRLLLASPFLPAALQGSWAGQSGRAHTPEVLFLKESCHLENPLCSWKDEENQFLITWKWWHGLYFLWAGVVLFLRDTLIGQSGFQLTMHPKLTLNSDSFASTSLVLGWPVCTPHPVHVVLVLNPGAHTWSVSTSHATELHPQPGTSYYVYMCGGYAVLHVCMGLEILSWCLGAPLISPHCIQWVGISH